MVTGHERIGDALVFHAGSGEWFNQPGNYRWDIGEDAEPRPPSPWHVELQQAIDRQETSPHSVVIDVTGMAHLVGVDWGFLITLGKRLSQGGTRVAVAATRNNTESARIIRLHDFFDLCGSVDEALSKG